VIPSTLEEPPYEALRIVSSQQSKVLIRKAFGPMPRHLAHCVERARSRYGRSDSFECRWRNGIAARPRGVHAVEVGGRQGGLYDRNWVRCWKCVLERVIERLFLVLPRRMLGATAISSMRFTTTFGSVFHLYPGINWL
jgi:hypothetical protein